MAELCANVEIVSVTRERQHLRQGTTPDDIGWYAIQVSKNSEHRVEKLLTYKQFKTYLPSQSARRRYCDRTKIIETPLYPGYLFCRCESQSLLAIKMTPGVAGVVGFGGKPSRIPESEVESVRLLISSHAAVTAVDRISPGRKVEVISGPLKTLQGVVTSTHGTDVLAVAISLLNRCLVVRLDALDVELCPRE